MVSRCLDLPQLLSHVPLFRELDPKDIADLARGCQELRPRRGERLFERGDRPTGFYLVAHGRVKLAFLTPHGSEKVVELIGPGQSFGEAVMFMEKPFPVYAEALTDSLLVHVAKEALFQAMERDARLARRMLAGLSLRLHSLIRDMEAYCALSAAQRVVGYLLRHEQPPEGGLVVDLPASKQVIASRLNLSPETFSRILHGLAEAGLIRVDGRRITVPDVEALRRHGS